MGSLKYQLSKLGRHRKHLNYRSVQKAAGRRVHLVKRMRNKRSPDSDANRREEGGWQVFLPALSQN